MNTIYLQGGRYWAEPGECVVATLAAGDVLGIVTARPNGHYYASVLESKDYGYGVVEWEECRRVLSRSLVGSASEGLQLVEQALRSSGLAQASPQAGSSHGA